MMLHAPPSARAPLIPRHALPSNHGNWTACAAGFFRTTPTSPLGTPTCRACGVAVCELGQGIAACTPTENAHCVPCPTLPAGRAFVQPGDCVRTRCLDGWRLHKTDDACLPCDAGWICRDGAQSPCPGNCTDTVGASQLLQCAGGPMEDVQLQYTLATAGDGPLPAAPSDALLLLDTLMHRWLLYGIYQGCARVSLDVTGTLTCTLSVPQCVRAPFREWLLEQLPAQQAAIAATQGASAIRMSAPRIRVLSSPLRRYRNASFSSSSANARPTHAPALIIHPRAWGQSHLETLLTLGVCAAVVGGLTAGVAAACALAYVRWWTTTSRHAEARKLRA